MEWRRDEDEAVLQVMLALRKLGVLGIQYDNSKWEGWKRDTTDFLESVGVSLQHIIKRNWLWYCS
jgi:hypothetical protein